MILYENMLKIIEYIDGNDEFNGGGEKCGS